MKTIVSQLETAFRTAIRLATGEEADPLIAPAQNDKFGDYQSNAAMGLAKAASDKTGQKVNPRSIAEKIKATLDSESLLKPLASEISIAGPGFINVRLAPEWLSSTLQTVATSPNLAIEPVEKPQTVVVDLSGPNVAKELHVGHIRSTIIGDAIARVLETVGDKVIRQNHIGDWGTQFGMLIAYKRERLSHPTADGSTIAEINQFYVDARKRFDSDPSFADTARKTVVAFQAGGEEELAIWRQIVDASRNHYQPLYERLNVKLTPADEFGESKYNSMLPAVVQELKSLGIATISEGATVVFVDGFEAPLIIEKTGGGYGYATTDLAAVKYRLQTLHAQRAIYVVGAPQSQHFKQIFAVAGLAKWVGSASLEHVAFGSMLGEDGKAYAARKGGSVKLADVLDEAVERARALVDAESPELPESQRANIARAVGIGAVKYGDLSKDRTSDYVFSWETMLSMRGNSGPYLQYAHARIRSIFRKAGVVSSADHGNFAAPITLETPQELAMAKHILRLNEIIEQVARDLRPHQLCGYLFELATRFSAFYEHCPVVSSPEPRRSSRLALCGITARTLAFGLDLLGIEHPEQM